MQDTGAIPDAALVDLAGGNQAVASAVKAGRKLSRGQRKRLLRKQRFLDQFDSAGSVLRRSVMSPAELKRQQEAQRGLGGMQSLSAMLGEVDTSSDGGAVDTTKDGAGTGTAAVHHVTSNKARRRMMLAEAQHLEKVVAHPAFVTDPLAALQQHLTATTASAVAASATAAAAAAATGNDASPAAATATAAAAAEGAAPHPAAVAFEQNMRLNRSMQASRAGAGAGGGNNRSTRRKQRGRKPKLGRARFR